MPTPILQLALDTPSLGEALRLAERALPGGVDWLEAGTPLIKCRGLDAVRRLRHEFPRVKLVADMKTIDGAALEVGRAAEAGADIVTALGVANDETLAEAVETAREWGVAVAVDMIAVPQPVQRARRAEELGAAQVCLHMGTASREYGEPDLDLVREVTGAVKLPVCVAGGMTETSARLAVEAGATVIIVGSAIAAAGDPAEAAARVKAALWR
jgi:3-hexulose-6-phosphate synthase/6-phospho-3-hexuloisomerase